MPVQVVREFICLTECNANLYQFAWINEKIDKIRRSVTDSPQHNFVTYDIQSHNFRLTQLSLIHFILADLPYETVRMGVTYRFPFNKNHQRFQKLLK